MAPAAVNPSTVLDRVDDDAALRLARALIRIPGVNPPGDEAVVAEWLAGFLEEAGLAVEVSEVLPGRPNALATAQFGDGAPERPHGPGSIRQVAHQANEFVPLEELRAATRIYALLIADLLGRED